ncbi:MAG: glycosyltransferase [Clostridia bacterium]|nr:glycosyltransferase [Clostridia bacterium]
MEKLKIAETLDTFYPGIDGPTFVVKNYAENLIKDHDCEVFVPKTKKSLKYKDNHPFKVVRCTSWLGFEGYRNAMPWFDKSFKKYFKEKNFDVIHTHSPLNMGKFSVEQGKKLKIPTIITLHTKFKDDFNRVLHGFKPLVNFMMRRIMRVINSADSVWTVNDASKKVLRDYGYKGDIVVVRNGTDYTYPINDTELTQKVNSIHNLSGKKNVFLFVGRIAMYKNLKLIIDALKILADDGIEFTMIFVGGGFDYDELVNYTNKKNLTDKVIFTGPIRDRELLQGYYLRSDLFLFPSTFDTSSLVPIEAAAHKLPVLLIEGSDTAENIVDNYNGFLSKENANCYAEKIKTLISSPNKLKEVGITASKTIYRTWEDVTNDVIKEYKKVILDYKNR